MQPPSAQTAPGWDGILAPGETILWQGQAAPRPDWLSLLHKRSLSGGILIAFALAWLGMTLPQTSLGGGDMPLIFPLFGVILLGIGLTTMMRPVLRQYRRLQATTYTLTSQRALIATALDGKRDLQSHQLGPQTRPALEDGTPGSVWFASDPGQSKFWQGSGAGGSYGTVQGRIGFEAIAEARQVYRLLLDQLDQLAKQPPPPEQEKN